jgi:hypothetical protein
VVQLPVALLGEAHHHHDHTVAALNEENVEASHQGCHCPGLGCVSSSPGIASLITEPFFEMAPAVFDPQEDLAGLHVAHGLDLIRRPSKF